MNLGGRDFEDEVRRVARQLWPGASYSGASIEDGRERDGLFETEWVIHLIEATTWRTKDKAEIDIEKLVKLRRRLATRGKPVQCWFITQSEPTAEQRAVAPKDGSVNVLSFEQFRSKLVDAHTYLRDRSKYPFGSARDPATGAVQIKEEYVPLTLVPTVGSPVKLDELVGQLVTGTRVVLLGDFGAGKSMTMRALFDRLAAQFRKSATTTFPIHLNLRDHHGQNDPAEAIARHARSIGYSDSNQLVRAWRAGYAHLLLDGFDEMATPGWVGPTTRMRDIRRRSVELVRRFVRETPVGVGVALAGRAHYFDSEREMITALGATPPFVHYSLGEFSDEQIEEYLKKHGWASGLPEWLPARPLLLAYLANRGLLGEALAIPVGSSPAMAWHSLLTLVCDREAELEANIDGATVRQVVERIASIARGRSDGLGPLEFGDIDHAFRTVCSYAPDDRAMVLLQRLPGLGPTDQESGTRRFMDASLADTARAGDVTRYAQNFFDEEPAEAERWGVSLGTLGAEVAAYQLDSIGTAPSKVAAAARHTGSAGDRSYLASDLTRIAALLGGKISGSVRLPISNVWIEALSLDDPDMDLSGVEFRDCVVEELDVPRDGAPSSSMPLFIHCHFGCVDGRTSARDLPSDQFVECTFDTFAEAGATTASLLATSLPLGQRVALTVVKKLYLQRGSGRKESALFRGLAQQERVVVREILDILESHKLATKTQTGKQRVWVPTRRATPRVRAMIDGPTVCDDPAWTEFASLR